MKNEFQQMIDQELSELTWNDACRREVRSRIIQSRVLKKPKGRLAISLALVLVLAMSIAVAAGVRFSRKYDAQQAAEAALSSAYGITDEMLAFFSKSMEENNGAHVFIYRGLEDLSGMLGVYTVTVKEGTASAAWSLSDQPAAWGSEKLMEIAEVCKMEGGFSAVVEEARTAALESGVLRSAGNNMMPSEEEIKAYASQQAQEENEAKARAKFSWEEIDQLARAAIQQRYGLNDVQMATLELVDESSWWKMEDGKPIVQPYYWLTQAPDGWTEGDGIYIVDVNVESGVIEGILYDSAIAGNG